MDRTALHENFFPRAKQLHSAGFTTMEKIAKARPTELSAKIEHLSLKAAMAIIQVTTLDNLKQLNHIKFLRVPN